MDAAHFVVPQGSAYDEERWLRATRTYFVPYLLATLNHLTYARGLRDLRACVAAPAAANDCRQKPGSPERAGDPHNRLGELRDRLLAHRLASSFQRISKRENVDRFAASVRRAQGIDASLATLESVIKDKDDLDRSRQNNATFVATLELQSRVEWIEVLLLAVYGLEATHLMSASLGWEATHFQTLSYPVLALAFLVVGFFVVAPHDHRTKISFRRVAWGLLATAAVLVAWALLGLLIHGSDAHGAGSPHALPGGGGRLSPPAAEGPAVREDRRPERPDRSG
jgi:hypothetical protein